MPDIKTMYAHNMADAEDRIEAFDKCVLDGLSRTDEVQMDAVAISPLIEGLSAWREVGPHATGETYR